MAKVKKAKTEKATQSTQRPLDDPRWRYVAEIIEQHFPHSKDNKILIAQDLTKALASEKVHCMRRHTQMGHHEPDGELPASFWAEHRFECSPNGDIRAFSGTWIVNWAFYLWQPDCVKAWPPPQAVEAEATEPLRRKPGRRPTKNWKLEVAVEVGLHVRQGKPIPTAKQLAQFCLDEIDYEPDPSDVQKWLRELLNY